MSPIRITQLSNKENPRQIKIRITLKWWYVAYLYLSALICTVRDYKSIK